MFLCCLSEVARSALNSLGNSKFEEKSRRTMPSQSRLQGHLGAALGAANTKGVIAVFCLIMNPTPVIGYCRLH